MLEMISSVGIRLNYEKLYIALLISRAGPGMLTEINEIMLSYDNAFIIPHIYESIPDLYINYFKLNKL
jgi:hypothetical protein